MPIRARRARPRAILAGRERPNVREAEAARESSNGDLGAWTGRLAAGALTVRKAAPPTPEARLALQSEPGSSPSYPKAAAPGHQLASV